MCDYGQRRIVCCKHIRLILKFSNSDRTLFWLHSRRLSAPKLSWPTYKSTLSYVDGEHRSLAAVILVDSSRYLKSFFGASQFWDAISLKLIDRRLVDLSARSTPLTRRPNVYARHNDVAPFHIGPHLFRAHKMDGRAKTTQFTQPFIRLVVRNISAFFVN